MNIKFNAEKRELGRKSDLKNIRNRGYIPAVIYGEGKTGINISLEEITFLKEYKKTIGEMVFFDISVDGKKYTTIIKDRQFNPLTHRLTHIDFQQLHKGKAITLNVPLKYTGEPSGVKSGGSLEILVRELEISCLPKDIPEDIVVDVSKLEIGDAIHLQDVKLAGLDTKMPKDTPIVAVRAPRREEELEKEKEEEAEEKAEEAEAEESAE
ncbi:MAG: 50S ribosomal protein L25 [Candidatus Cloacimonetes bacterium]|nr:50S ribosomal protein L25 [Candidatus Cloacimonadota bacterium]